MLTSPFNIRPAQTPFIFQQQMGVRGAHLELFLRKAIFLRENCMFLIELTCERHCLLSHLRKSKYWNIPIINGHFWLFSELLEHNRLYLVSFV